MTTTRRYTPATAPLTAEHAQARAHSDARARERRREVPHWAAQAVDRALAERLVRDDELPLSPDKLCDLVREHFWTLDILRTLVGAGILDREDAALLSWPARILIARAALDAGPNLADDIADLRAQLAQEEGTS